MNCIMIKTQANRITNSRYNSPAFFYSRKFTLYREECVRIKDIRVNFKGVAMFYSDPTEQGYSWVSYIIPCILLHHRPYSALTPSPAFKTRAYAQNYTSNETKINHQNQVFKPPIRSILVYLTPCLHIPIHCKAKLSADVQQSKIWNLVIRVSLCVTVE